MSARTHSQADVGIPQDETRCILSGGSAEAGLKAGLNVELNGGRKGGLNTVAKPAVENSTGKLGQFQSKRRFRLMGGSSIGEVAMGIGVVGASLLAVLGFVSPFGRDLPGVVPENAPTRIFERIAAEVRGMDVGELVSACVATGGNEGEFFRLPWRYFDQDGNEVTSAGLGTSMGTGGNIGASKGGNGGKKPARICYAVLIRGAAVNRSREGGDEEEKERVTERVVGDEKRAETRVRHGDGELRGKAGMGGGSAAAATPTTAATTAATATVMGAAAAADTSVAVEGVGEAGGARGRRGVDEAVLTVQVANIRNGVDLAPLVDADKCLVKPELAAREGVPMWSYTAVVKNGGRK